MHETISSHVAKFSVRVRFLKLQCEQHLDITNAVTGTIDTTSTAAGDATTATAPANIVTTSQAADTTTNSGVPLSYLTPSGVLVVTLLHIVTFTLVRRKHFYSLIETHLNT